MGEMCHGFKDDSGGGWSRGISSSYSHPCQNSRYDVEPTKNNLFYRVGSWKNMFFKTNENSCQHSENKNSTVQENEKDYMVMKLEN